MDPASANNQPPTTVHGGATSRLTSAGKLRRRVSSSAENSRVGMAPPNHAEGEAQRRPGRQPRSPQKTAYLLR